ncbi:IS630 family transposase [Glutamicibacter protophormiae]|uniref:IS630 family transposase n=1 Tax=Glutamicibacter protophormiae TaxID=37930 RepID=UPI003A8E051E
MTDAALADPANLTLPACPLIQFTTRGRPDQRYRTTDRSPHPLADHGASQIASLDQEPAQRRQAHPGDHMARNPRSITGFERLYFRHGTTSLFAAMNVSDGTVIASTHRRHRAVEFKKFLQKIDQNVPEHLDIHVVCDNYGTHKHPSVNTWLERNPRFHMHFTPTYSSWINQVERLFAEVTRDLLQRSDHRSVQALEKDLRGWVKAWNENPKPFIWTKTADQILESLGRLLQRINGAGH